jgi:hypothetical protein
MGFAHDYTTHAGLISRAMRVVVLGALALLPVVSIIGLHAPQAHLSDEEREELCCIC